MITIKRTTCRVLLIVRVDGVEKAVPTNHVAYLNETMEVREATWLKRGAVQVLPMNPVKEPSQ
jgi:hypothetical protein